MKVFKIPSVFQAIDGITAPLKSMYNSVRNFCKRSEEDVAKFERRWRSLGDTAQKVARKSLIIGAALAAPLVLAARDAIAFEDRMADIAKTTGLSGVKLDQFGQNLLDLAPATRTSIEELQQIAAIGGQMGVAQDELLGFTDSVNKFNVALGSDFGGGVEEATRAISGLKNLFKETRGLNVADAITKAGSSINALSAKGVQVPELTEFINRLGALPDAIKPAITDVAALGAVMNKSGITAERAGRGLVDVMLTGAKNIPAFAKQMGITATAAKDLINSNPTVFLAKFAESLKGMDAVKLAKKLNQLKIGDSGAIAAIGALSSNTKMLAEFQALANDEFAKGTSLLNEYNTKNNTTAGNLKKAVNGFKAISIAAGSQLLPIINDLIKQFLPFVKTVLEWIRNNPKLVKGILLATAAFSALAFVVSGIAGAITLYSQVMLIASNATKIVTAAQWLWNVAMMANPIGLIVAAVIILIAEIVILVKYFDQIGQAWLMMMGPIGWVIALVRVFAKEWDHIMAAFDVSFLEGIKAIGKTLLDFVLWPLQQIIDVIANVTGAEWAVNAAKSLEAFRKELGVTVDNPVNPEKTKTDVINKSVEEKNQTLSIDINDNSNGKASIDTTKAPEIPVNLSTTMGWGMF